MINYTKLAKDADQLELYALEHGGNPFSCSPLGESDEETCPNRSVENDEASFQDALSECERRKSVLGDRYPFMIGNNSIAYVQGDDTLYITLLKMHYETNTHLKGERFEKQCYKLVSSFIQDRGRVYHIGTARENGQSTRELCGIIFEKLYGGKPCVFEIKNPNFKDGGADMVVTLHNGGLVATPWAIIQCKNVTSSFEVTPGNYENWLLNHFTFDKDGYLFKSIRPACLLLTGNALPINSDECTKAFTLLNNWNGLVYDRIRLVAVAY
jgi:hypothetical protein